MRGLPDFNYPAFYSAAHVLRKMGWSVISPAEMDAYDHGLRHVREYAERDLKAILWLRPELGDIVVVLPGHESSVGATAEKSVAVWVGLSVATLEMALQIDVSAL